MTVFEATQRRLEGELAEVCGHLNVLHERMVSITREALATEAWSGAGINTPVQWLAWQTGLSPERARQIVHAAERQAELPVTFQAFADGLLSIDQVAAVIKRTPAHNDAEASELARHATVAQLRIALGKHFFPPQPNPDADPVPGPQPQPQPQPPVARTYQVQVGFNDDGDLFLHALADAADGSLIHTALREAKDALFRAGNTAATWLDALTEVARRSLAAVGSIARRDLYKVIVHLDREGGWLHKGPHLPTSLLQRLLCDGVIQPLWTSEGLPINLGRRRHIAPLQTRIVVENRDRVCRHPACASTIGLEIHHIVHWYPDGGRTDTDNLICLCAKHHAAHHRGEFTVTGNADLRHGLTFRDARGRVIEGVKAPTPPGTTPPPRPAKPYQRPLGETLDYDSLWFSPEPPPPTTIHATTAAASTTNTTVTTERPDNPPTDHHTEPGNPHQTTGPPAAA